MARPPNAPPTLGDFRRLAGLVQSWSKPLLVTHRRADGDALGGLLAMRGILEAQGRSSVAAVFEAPSPRYAFLPGVDSLHILAGPDDPVLCGIDGVLIVDTCSRSQLAPFDSWLAGAQVPRVALDHHATRDDIADEYLIDAQAAAACLLVWEWAGAAGWSVPPAAGQALLTGIATDTGWFRFASTDPRILRAAAGLVAAGVSIAALYDCLYQRETAVRVRLHALATARMDLIEEGRLAVLGLTAADFAATGAGPADTEDLVNAPLVVAGVELAALLVDAGDGVVRCSFRSKGGVDVATFAAGLGGGGHRMASGARIAGGLAEVKPGVVQALRAALSGT